MIYTGNNGRIYLARRSLSGLQGTFTATVLPGRYLYQGEKLFVRNITGFGTGAVVYIDRTINANATSRSAVFTVFTAGSSYEADRVIRFARNRNGTVEDVTGDISITSTQTIGVDNEKEILADQYRIAKIRNWTLNSNSEVIETTSLGDVTKTYSPSVTSGDGSATLMFYEDDQNNNRSDAMKDSFELRDILWPQGPPPRIIMSLAIDGSTNGSSTAVGGQALWKTNWLFNAYITSVSTAVSYGEVVTTDISFTIDGPFLDKPWKPGVAAL